MAHELLITNGVARTFHVESEGAPWHKLGTAVQQALTAAEAITAAGLDYKVISLPLFAATADGYSLAAPDHRLNVRRDPPPDGSLALPAPVPLGVVSDRYRVIQNRDAFAFLDGIVAEGGCYYHTAGALGAGERVWMLAKLPGHVRVVGDDVVDKYLLLYNSHDASSALRVLWTPVRVVCANTVSAALAQGAGAGITIRHTGEIDRKIDEARRVLGLASAYFDAFGEGAALLAGYRPDGAWLDTYFRALCPDPKTGEPAKAKATRMTWYGLYEQGMGQDMPGVRGTAWAALNAITEHQDHHIGSDARRRMESSWYGDASKLKRDAYALAIDMVSRPHADHGAVAVN